MRQPQWSVSGKHSPAILPATDAIWPSLSLLTQVVQPTFTPDAKDLVVPDSGHLIHAAQPQAIIDAVTDVVEAVRDPRTWQEVPATPTS